MTRIFASHTSFLGLDKSEYSGWHSDISAGVLQFASLIETGVYPLKSFNYRECSVFILLHVYHSQHVLKNLLPVCSSSGLACVRTLQLLHLHNSRLDLELE